MELENVAEIEVEIQESGPAGEQGPPGLSAYEVYLVNGGTLSEKEWLESLKGETGQPGSTPVKGEDYFTEEDIASLKIPTKVSDLENDSGFITDYEETDPTIADFIKNITEEDINRWNNPDKDPNHMFTYSVVNEKQTYEIEENYTIAAEIIKLVRDNKTVKAGAIVNDLGTSNINQTIIFTDMNADTYLNDDMSGVLTMWGNYINEYKAQRAYGIKFGLFMFYKFECNYTINTDDSITVTSCKKTSNFKYLPDSATINDFIGVNNTNEFTPTGDYNPATKKYVDDSVATLGDYVDEQLANIDIPEVDIDLSNYYTKDEIEVLMDQNEPGSKIYVARDVYSSVTASPLNISATSTGGKNILAAVQKAYDNGDYKMRLRMCASDPTLIPQYVDTVFALPESGSGSITETTTRTYVRSNLTTTTLKYYYFSRSMSMSAGTVTSGTNVGSIYYKEDTMVNTTKLNSTLNDYSTTEIMDQHIASAIAPFNNLADDEVEFSVDFTLSQLKSTVNMYRNIGYIEGLQESIKTAFEKAAAGDGKLSIIVNFARMSDRPGRFKFYQQDLITGENINSNYYFSSHYVGTNYTNVSGLPEVSELRIIVTGEWTDGVFNVEGISIFYLRNRFIGPDNTNSYTPTGNYHPATKKYVDDAITAAIKTVLEAEY